MRSFGSSAGGHSRPVRKLPVESPYGYSGPTGNPLAAQKMLMKVRHVIASVHMSKLAVWLHALQTPH